MNTSYKDISIHYEIIGDGECIVWLHGWGCDLSCYRDICNNFYNKTNILIDMPPFGKSDEPYQPFTLLDYVEIVIKILNENDIKKASIVGHSFGGRIAIMLASMHQKRIEKLVLIDSAGLKNRSFGLLLKKIKIKTFKLLKKDTSRFQSSDYKELSLVMKRTFSNIIKVDLLKSLKTIKNKTLLIWGDSDTETPISMAKKFKRKLVCSKLVIFERCGHFAFLDDKQRFIYYIKEFFKDELF